MGDPSGINPTRQDRFTSVHFREGHDSRTAEEGQPGQATKAAGTSERKKELLTPTTWVPPPPIGTTHIQWEVSEIFSVPDSERLPERRLP